MAIRSRSSSPVPSVRIKDAGEPPEVFKALADPTRRALLDKLREGERPMMQLAAEFDMSAAAVSQHLKILREAGLVREQRQGRHRIYHLVAAPLREVADWVSYYEQFWRTGLEKLGEHLRSTP